MTTLFVDGWFGPDPGDWQELWALGLPGSARVVQDDWERPERGAWMARLDEAVRQCAEPPVLVAHSLGCVTLAHWVADGARWPVRAALLATPADVETNRKPEIRGFDPIPRVAFPFPTILAASRNDSWMTPDRARSFARDWGARLVDAGEVGHLTVGEGVGRWPAGAELHAELLGDGVSALGPST
ncbi:RBBP9/YdeN family alpha/beta hydrolase [Solihabitans fulvus]|nr:alpha/beta hydrolase [Solihabitans fulvus]